MLITQLKGGEKMNYNNRKGQAAMEFLMTYGWAILAAIVVIAVLAIYFRPSSIVAGNQVLTAPFNALGSQFSPGLAKLEFKNNGGEAVTLYSAKITITTPSGATCNDATAANFTDTTVDVGGTSIVSFGGCSFVAGNNVNAQVSLNYTSGSEGTLPKTATGTIKCKS
jgi:uncharacterized protein (UPF0333 family)